MSMSVRTNRRDVRPTTTTARPVAYHGQPRPATDTSAQASSRMATEPENELYARAPEDTAVMESLLMAQYDRLKQYVVYRLNRHLNGLVSPEDLVQDIC